MSSAALTPASDPSRALEVLSALDPDQREAAEAVRGPVCILAGAGTGKTRTITHRIAYAVLSGTVDAEGVLAVTFTARAAGELRGRLRALGVGGVQARTFHAAALRQLTYFWPQVVGGEPPRLVESKLRLVAEAVTRSLRVSLPVAELRDVTSEIEWAKSSLVSPTTYADEAARARRQPPRPPETIAAVFEAYEEVKSSSGQLDFEDLLLLTSAMIEEHREVAARVRGQYRYFVVDEYQDVNPLQQQLLSAWLGPRDDLCVVGDAQQTIYSFTGASPDYLVGFTRRWPEATVVRLTRDYRSTPQVVSLANGVLAKATGDAGALRLALVAQRPNGPEPIFREVDDETAEAVAVAQRVGQLIAAGTPAREIAILYRVNAQSETYEQSLAAAGIPYLVRGGDRFFERREVREAVTLLRGAARSTDSETEGEGLAATVRHVFAAASWSPTPPSGTGAARERWESLAALVRLAEELEAANPAAAMADLGVEIEQRQAAQHAPPVDGVTLASLHAAKGLEWDAVFLVGLVDGTLPIVHAETPAQVEEERRLLYVGVTRAREHLWLSWALARSPGGARYRKPSRFLDGLLPASMRKPAAAERTTGSPSRKRAATVSCRVCGRVLAAAVERKLGRCEDCPSDRDEALFERLREWRLARSKERSQPAFVVFTDATLTAIAEAKPRSVAELVAIPGVGQRKLDEFGAEVLALVADSTG
ncbi:ATP-dependent DNA helicase UvrD2 [Acidothermaceae bacterium B102]|nr:ATP-dependent DNA helicase UvrD2 [Acidothermaceae bacterium B102]